MKNAYLQSFSDAKGKWPVIKPDCEKSGENGKKSYQKWAVPSYMYPDDYYPAFAHGSGFLIPLSWTTCLFQEGLGTRYLWHDDVFVAGLVRVKCGMGLRNTYRVIPEHQDWKRNCWGKRALVIHHVPEDPSRPGAMQNIHKFITRLSFSCRFGQLRDNDWGKHSTREQIFGHEKPLGLE